MQFIIRTDIFQSILLIVIVFFMPMSFAYANSFSCKPIELILTRNKDMSITAKAYAQQIKAGECVRATNKWITISTARGTISPTTKSINGLYNSLISPDKLKTGEYIITASMSPNIKNSVTAVVFDKVHPRWGQPMAVSGIVNSRGWEDSPFISPDGQYLFMMYLPISASCLLEKDSHKASCFKYRGPIDESSRPGLSTRFGKGRFKKNGNIAHSCLSVGDVYTEELFKKYSVIIPPMISYGFKRQPDGHFGKPFPITLDGVDACVSPSGVDVSIDAQGNATALMGLVDPSSWNTDKENDYPSLFSAQIDLNKPNALAIWDKKNKRLKGTKNKLKLLFGQAMKNRQDNPHAVTNPKTGKIEAIFWDSEHNDEDIFYRLLKPGGVFPDGPWGPVKKTPVFSSMFKQEIQPFFDGKVLTVSRGTEIASRDFYSEDFKDIADSDKWGEERIELAISEKTKGTEINALHGVGDPTYATIDGKKYLYFVYLKRAQDGLLDFNIGFVKEK